MVLETVLRILSMGQSRSVVPKLFSAEPYGLRMHFPCAAWSLQENE